jgi:phage tail sheath gpL-like
MATTEVPSGYVLPLFVGSARPADAVPATAAQKLVLVGPALSGTGSPSDPGSNDAAAALWGKGSAVHRMYMKAKAAYPTGQIHGLGVADGAGTAREMTITYTASASAVAGTHRVRIGSEYVDVPLPAYASSTAATEHAGALACDALFPAVSDMLFKSKAAATLGVATIKCRHLGEIGNQVRIATDEDTPVPTGWTATIVQSVAGATDPALVVANLGASTKWNKLAFALDAWYETFSAEMTARWGWSRMLRGHAFSGKLDATYDAAITDLTTTPRTCQAVTRLKLNAACRAPAFEAAAVLAAVAMQSDEVDPGLKIGGLTLPGCQAERIGSEYSESQRNAITYFGGTTYFNAGGLMAIDRCVTTRYQDIYGNRDLRAYSAPKMWLVDYLLTDLRAFVYTYWARVRLLARATGKVPASCTTPESIHDCLVSWYKGHARVGLVQGVELFDKNLTVTVPADDEERVDESLPADVARNLELFAALMTY